MAITATDYQWINDYSDLAEAYCVVLVRGVTVQEFLRGMQAKPQGNLSGYTELEQRTRDVWEQHSGNEYLIGATTVPGDQGEWVLGLEINGYLGTLPHLVAPLSSGTRLVAHFCNVNAHDRFLWYEDGTLRTFFEPLFPIDRDGSTPDELVELMAEVGFDLRADEEEVADSLTTEAAFALAARLTGAHLTPELLGQATFTAGLVPWSATKA
ncbi:hypothetical protein GCM10009678_85660 [Actinomadura kijaniata]|uniref:Uncharacterized protein n=1 Tax=Actinomadura namibiensis TaxID=182080 RepID=A0A7W3QSG2_ACTNM|nr:DUF6461 domain-containing protein [Actinomadura namibiensis]MBA8957686.1 hypothetical protein [Actinomadura namibiensis]